MREREREGGRERGRDRERGREGEREGEREREREREKLVNFEKTRKSNFRERERDKFNFCELKFDHGDFIDRSSIDHKMKFLLIADRSIDRCAMIRSATRS